MTPSALKRGGAKPIHSRDSIIEALKRYAALYGDDFTAAAFSPSTAKWRDLGPELIDRYYLGDPDTGRAWPSLNSIKMPFGGFNAARVAAGLQPNRPGPGSKHRPAGMHAPARDVSHVNATRIVYRERDNAAVARERDEAVRRAERAEDRLARAVKPPPRKVKVVTDDTALAAARKRARDANAAATRLASRLERTEARAQTTISDLRATVLGLRRSNALLERRAIAAEGDERTVEVERVVERIVEKPVDRIVEKIVTRPAPEEAVLTAARERAREAVAGERAAIRRAEKAEAAYIEVAKAARGVERRLTSAELRELKRSGPAGPAALAAELKALARARAGGSGDVREILVRVAAAAVSWRERL